MSEPTKFELHPVQLNGVNVKQLYIEITNTFAAQEGTHDGDVQIFNGHSDYDEGSKSFHAFMKAEIGMDRSSSSPFRLCCEIQAQFLVTDDSFDVNMVPQWARNAAPYILLPYLREHVYGLSTRAGLPGVTLPLIQLPAKA